MVQLPPWSVLVAISSLKMIVAGGLLFVGAPYLMFPPPKGDGRTTVLQRAIWTVFFGILAVHILVIFHMYSGIGVVGVVLLVTAIRLARLHPSGSRRSVGMGFLAAFGDVTDQKVSLLGAFWTGFVRRLRRIGDHIRQIPLGPLLAFFLLAVVIGVAAWERFAPVFASAALPYSDAPIELAWMKFIIHGNLYNAQVYPRGLYAIMSLLSSFSGTSPVIVLRLSTPFLSIGVLVAASYFVWRMTRSLTAAAVTALLLSAVPILPFADIGNYLAAISEQFGTIFTLLFAAFAADFIRKGDSRDAWTAAAAAGIDVFTHPVPTALLILALVGSCVVGLLLKGKVGVTRSFRLLLLVGGAAAVAALPLAWALLGGEPWHASSIQFLNLSAPTLLPAVPPLMALSLSVLVFGVIVTVLASKFSRRGEDQDHFTGLALLAGVALSISLLYVLPYIGIKSAAVFARGNQGATIGAAIASGLVWTLIEGSLARRFYLVLPITAAIILLAFRYYPPAPDTKGLYNYYTDQMIYQFLRADATFVPETWTLVTGDTGYALAVDESFHQYPGNFVQMADHLPPNPRRWLKVGAQLGYGVSSTYVFMVEKVIPHASFQGASYIDPRLKASAELERWIFENRNRMHIHEVYNGSQVSVWTLSLP